MKPNFKKGLLTAVVQNVETKEVLMVAYMNEAAFQLSIETGYVTFYSRSRDKLWVKGETSGNRMRLVQMRLDCDADALLVQVMPVGPACHTGAISCFFREVT